MGISQNSSFIIHNSSFKQYYLMGTPALLSLAWIIGLIFIILK